MKLSSSNFALATLALSPSLLSSPVFAAPTPDVGGLSPNPSTGYFAESPQPQAVESPLLQGTPTLGGTPTLTGTPSTSKIAGRRRSIKRHNSVKFHAREPSSDSLGLGLGIGLGLFGSNYAPGVHIRAMSPLDPVSGESVASEGLSYSASSVAPSSTVAPVTPVDPSNILGSHFSEAALKDSSSPYVSATEYRYPQHDARDVQPSPLVVEGTESPFLNSPVPHDAPTFPSPIHHQRLRRQSGRVSGVGQVAAGSPLVGSLPVWGVPGVASGTIPSTSLPIVPGLGPNGLPVPNLDTLPLQNLGGAGSLPLIAPLGAVSQLSGTVPNPASPATGAIPQLGVDQLLHPAVYPLSAVGGNPSVVHGVTDTASGLLPNPSVPSTLPNGPALVGSAKNLVGSVAPGVVGQVQGLEGMLPGVGGMVSGIQGMAPNVGGIVPAVGGVVPGVQGIVPGVSSPLSALKSTANLLPVAVAGAAVPGVVPGLGSLPISGALPVSGSNALLNTILAPASPEVASPLKAVTGAIPYLSSAALGVVPIPKSGGILGGQGGGMGTVTGAAPGIVPSVDSLPVPLSGANVLPVPAAAAPLGAVSNILGASSTAVDVPNIAGVVPGLVGTASGLLPTSISMPLPSGAPALNLVPAKGDMGAPGVAPEEPEVGIYKATSGMGAMGRPDEMLVKQAEEERKGGNDAKQHVQGGIASEAASFTIKSAEPSNIPSLAPTSTSTSWVAPTAAASQVPSGAMAGPKDGVLTKSSLLIETPPTPMQVVKQATPMPVTESLTAWVGVHHVGLPMPNFVPTSLPFSVPSAHATAAPLSAMPVHPLDGSDSSSSSSDEVPGIPNITVTESVHPTPVYYGGSPLSRASGGPTDVTKTVMDVMPSVTGAASSTGTLQWGAGLPKMTTSIVRAATATSGAQASGSTPGQAN
ncbi:hypothetical protein FRC07_013523 [Ceratobasidium sp. 392]|nr:hypothetical protein FRC07_013523 [Ceratobasidium sp. 392]